jgi:hypothetical protein
VGKGEEGFLFVTTLPEDLNRTLQLKKDYIPNYGDTIDLVVVAAGWDKDRARELRGMCTSLVRMTYF